jgi:hypothetical protein
MIPISQEDITSAGWTGPRLSWIARFVSPTHRRKLKSKSQDLALLLVQGAANDFVVQPKQWVGARTHAWNERAHRLTTYHGRLASVPEA